MSKSYAKACFFILFIPLLLFYISLAIPIVGLMTFKHLSSPLTSDCLRSAEGFIRGTCKSNGIDLGLVEGLYYASTLLTFGLANLLIAFLALAVFIPRYALIAWVAATLLFWHLKRPPRADA